MVYKIIEKEQMPITAFVTGDKVLVVGIGCCGMKKRLTDLGITPGTHIQIIKNQGRGPLLVYVRDVRIAIGRSLAQAIMCEKMA